MAIYKRDIVDINLETGNIHRSFLNHTIGYKDQAADHFGIRTFRNGEPVDLTGVSVQGVFMPPQGSPIAITSGNIVDGNVAEVVLPQACYNYDGNFTLAIKLVDGTNSITGTMRIVDGVVDNTHASGTVAPTSAVPTYQEILSTYDAMVAATVAANGAIAAAYSSSSTYAVGDYCIHDGGLYRCTTAITTAEAWTSGHWTAAKIGPDVSSLKSALDAFENTAEYLQLDYSTLTPSRMTIDASNEYHKVPSGNTARSMMAKIPDGTVAIKLEAGENGGLYAILNSDAGYSDASVDPDFSIEYPGRVSYTKDVVLQMYADTKYLYFVSTTSAGTDIKAKSVTFYFNAKKENEMENAHLFGRDIAKAQWQIGKYINYSGAVSTGSTWGLSQIFNVNPGDLILFDFATKDSNSVAFINGVHEYKGSTWQRTETVDKGAVLIVPDGINNIRFVFGRSGSTGVALTQSDISIYAHAYILRKKHGIFDGKRVSLIGTSDSTFAGFIPSENVTYYTGSNYGVLTVGNCWWHIGITENGGLPLINDSWSGSAVADGVRTPTSSNIYTPLVDVSRCQNLHAYQHGGTSSDTLVTNENIGNLRHSPWDADQTAWTVGEYLKEIDPDVIIINGGGNDYIHDCPMGTYDGHSTLAADAVTTFREAYANLINRIQSRYPYALVICCTPIYLTRPEMSNPPTAADKNQVNINGINLTYKDYQDAIKEIATLKGCPVIDGFVHGFSRYNYYNLFCSDSERGPVHPNALGHMVFGKDFSKHIAECVSGLIDFS